MIGSIIRPGGWLADRIGGATVTAWTFLGMVLITGEILIASNQQSLTLYTIGLLTLFVLSGIGNGSTYKMIPSTFAGRARLEIEAGMPKEPALMKARRLSGALIGIAGATGALGGVFINLAFRQSFLSTKSGDAAFWTFLVFRCPTADHDS